MLTWQVHLGSALEVLRELPEASAHCLLTSPPYFGLRDYGVATQIGREESARSYADALVEVLSAAKRVLTDDGVCWLNLGDSYVSAPAGNKPGQFSTSTLTNPQRQDRLHHSFRRDKAPIGNVRHRAEQDLKPKQLIGVPWRVAFALQSDGWYLRSDVIWAKPNPMPESVTDRPTKSHEYVFLLTKRERYAYNADAIREPVTQAMLDQIRQGYDGEGTKDYEGAGVQNPSSVKARIIGNKRLSAQFGVSTGRAQARAMDRKPSGNKAIPRTEQAVVIQGANARSVWSIPTEASEHEHFAVMPRALARKCILAGCPYGGTVLDPFAGTGTTGVVALEEGRNFVGVELNPKYHAIARERLANVAPLLASERSA